MFLRRERRVLRFQEKTGTLWNFLKIMKIQENCRKRGNQQKSRKTENATWRKTGPRPGPAWGPLLVYTTRIYPLASWLAVNVFTPFWISRGPGGALMGPHFGPPGAPPPGPQKSRNRKTRENHIFMKLHEIYGNL